MQRFKQYMKTAPQWVRFAWCNHYAHTVAFYGPNALLFLIHYFGLLQQYKIQKGKFPASELIKEALVDNLKADGVILYVIQFANAGGALQTLLQGVASGPASPFYHYAPDAETLSQVFREVANHLSELRLSK